MTKNRISKFLVVITALFLVLGTWAVPSLAQKKPTWITHFGDWAKKSGNQDEIEWTNRLSTPKALKLGQDWIDFLGYNAVDMVKKDMKDNNTAPSITPGITITRENVAQYKNDLKGMIPDWQLQFIEGSGPYNSPREMEIVPTQHWYIQPGFLEATKKYYKDCSLNENSELVGWTAGIPFPFPKGTPAEIAAQLCHDYDRLTIMGDNLNSLPMEFGLYGRDSKLERTEKAELHWKNYSGRVTIDPKPNWPGKEDIMEKGCIVALYPYDLKGQALIRTRFKDLRKEDSFVAYVPSMRRIRRFTGSNTQDPLLGADISWEDWKGFWTKLSQTIHPRKFVLEGEGIYLCSSLNPKPIHYETKYDGQLRRARYERRPCWIVRIDNEDPNYIYGARRMWVDKETFVFHYIEWYDQKGRLRLVWDWAWRLDPEKGELDYWDPTIADLINKHSTYVKHDITLDMPNVSENLFNLRFLSQRAH